MLHGEAVVVRDLPLLQQVADEFLAKYGNDTLGQRSRGW